MRRLVLLSLLILMGCGEIANAPAGGAAARFAGNRSGSTRLGTIFTVSTSGQERVIYRFNNLRADRGDGANPYAGLTNLNGTLYGTTLLGTSAGGTYNGTAFSVSATGSERLLHIFGIGLDGAYPYAGLIALNGKLYGTTQYGGAYERGTVFELNPVTGTERILYSFPANASPQAALTVVNGTLYGTASGGGTGCGSVFSITTAGKLRTLYEFTCKSNGAFPHAGLLALNGVLYGTTTEGGKSGPCCGTIFAVNLSSGKETQLHIFAGTPDGSDPFGTFIAVGGLLYGTTQQGGGGGHGSVYSVTPSGTVNVVYSFGGGTDGELPYSGVTWYKGRLYGTTPYGGGTTCSYYGTGCGTVYEVSRSGNEKVLYRFAGGTDGANPFGGLTALNGTLYGTTYYGGAER
ncbi:MAG TPA: choice-of-anchor tandem repeat GloVer-containing protein [Candidatus Cybelea sp.]|nr:choice-of-anchor tandem repeat GloVer-containing protein [Candidatus Cybelea sp.]